MSAGWCQAPWCDRELPPGRRRFCSDLCRVRGQRAERSYDAEDCGSAAVRMIVSVARRAGGSDLAVFGVLWEIRSAADQACVEAIDGLRARGFSWAQIATEAGLTRQGLTQGRGRRPGHSERNETLPPESP